MTSSIGDVSSGIWDIPIPIWKTSNAAASPQLESLLLRLAKYDVDLTYLKGKDIVIDDALNQVSQLDPESKDKENFSVIIVHHITSDIPAIGSQLAALRVATQANPVLSQLKHQIF